MPLLIVDTTSDGCAEWAHHASRGPNIAAPDNGREVITRIRSSAMNFICSRIKRLIQNFQAGARGPAPLIRTMDPRVA